MSKSGTKILKPDKARRIWLILGAIIALLIVYRIRQLGGTLYWIEKILVCALALLTIVQSITALVSARYDLVLSEEGCVVGSFWGKPTFRWRDLKAAGVVKSHRGDRIFVELLDESGTGKIRLLFLPDKYGQDPLEVVKLLLSWKRIYG